MTAPLDIHALVTGGTSGIGEAAVRQLAEAGARVSFCGRREILGRRIETEIRAAGGRARYFRADVREHAQVDRLIGGARECFGPLQFALNNAGISHPSRRTGELALEDIEDVFATNCRGLWLCMRAELANISPPGQGLIVNMASILGTGESAWLSAYGASKHAVIGLTISAAKEYRDTGPKIVALAPGPVDTPMYRRALEDAGEDRYRFAGGYPVGRIWAADDIARMIVDCARVPGQLSTGQVVVMPDPGDLKGVSRSLEATGS